MSYQPILDPDAVSPTHHQQPSVPVVMMYPSAAFAPSAPTPSPSPPHLAPSSASSAFPSSENTLNPKKLARWLTCLAITVVVLAVVSGVGTHLVRKKIETGIRNRLVISSNTSDGYAAWADSRDALGSRKQLKVYVWHLVNPEETLQGEAPFFQQKGPYIYHQITRRFNISFINQTYIQYNDWNYFVFDEELSVGSDSNIVTSLNVPFQAIRANTEPPLVKILYNSLAEKDRIFTHRSVKEIVWGYVDPQLEIAAAVMKIPDLAFYPGLRENLTSMEAASKYGPNLVYSGETDLNLVRHFKEWRGNRYVESCSAMACPPSALQPVWATAEASLVPLASDGTQFKPNLHKDSKETSFVDSTFRQFFLRTNQGKTKVVKGITLLEFEVDPVMWQNSTQHPDNALFFQNGPAGFINITRPQRNIPTFLCQPHFLGVDGAWWRFMQGDIRPDPDLHATTVAAEPTLGTAFEGHKRLQVNFFIRPMHFNDGGVWFQNIREMYWPVVWFEEYGQITDVQADKFKGSLYFGQRIERILQYGVSGLAVLLLLLWLYLYRQYRRAAKVSESYAPLSPSLNDPLYQPAVYFHHVSPLARPPLWSEQPSSPSSSAMAVASDIKVDA